ncbi:lipoyl protein ligase domain-containing protein [Pseudomonas fluorescens]|uniref:BPL/LPL catalytic domain-containing protein n=1 Tax=Pseudomonas fluorescens TaxID=294 RepID=A0A5E7VE15_PSEFL|nr:hypothetical protein [Pseudomonas fluorescens]VVQ20710.1 hypothetical protein PS928_05045 [Pseudomonas fluorescens]
MSALRGDSHAETGLFVAQLQCAHAEQAWIKEQLAAGIEVPQLALVEYLRPALIYGRRGGDEEAARRRAGELGYGLSRRSSGGGAVLTGSWLLGVELLLPHTHALAQLSPVESFRWFGRCWQHVLREQGYASRLADAASIATHNAAAQAAALDWICFAGLGHGELLDTEGRKLLGLAQYRGRAGVLLSAGLLLAATPWEDLEWIHLGQRTLCSTMQQQASAGLAGLQRDLLCQHLVQTLQTDLASAS